MEDRMEAAGMISIIIPVYNSKEGLAQCLDSVVSQSYSPIEVIVVDDCSKDGSLEICREYEKKYPFVHVYTKENEGVSAARNFGMKKAVGEYLQFVDSDDRLYVQTCERLVKTMKKNDSDVVIGGYYNERERRDNIPKPQLFEEKSEFMKAFPTLFTHFFIHVPWNKLYRKSSVQAQFPLGLSKGEDLLFNLQVLEGAGKIELLDESVYFYHNVNDNSLSYQFREDALEIEERLYRETVRFWNRCLPEEKPEFLYHFYLEAVKNKFYALVGRSGYDGAKCRAVIKQWLNKESIHELVRERHQFAGKDRILLELMKIKASGFLYRYYKIAGGK